MTFSSLTSLLRLCKVILFGALLCSVPIALVFLVDSVKAATGREQIQLVLATRSSTGFGVVRDLKRGFADGWNFTHRANPTAELKPVASVVRTPDFRLAMDPQTVLLHYPEPSPWKRVALFWLGASDRDSSLAWVIYFGMGSWLLWRLVAGISAEDPFTRDNARWLRGLALLVLGLYLEQQLAHLALWVIVPAFRIPDLAEPLSHYVRLSSEEDLPGGITGIICTVVATVYQRGVQLSREAELVI